MDLPEDVRNIIIALSILVGALQCFFGYRIFKVILGLTGFLLGGTLAGAIGYAISQEQAVALLAGLVGGFIGAALIVALYFIGVFLIGALLGGVLGTALFAVAESNPEPAVVLVLAVIAGIIAVIFQKFMIIVSTAFGGAWAVVTGIAHFTTGAVDPGNLERMFRSAGSHLYAILLCWLALGIVGVVVQYKSAPRKEKKAEPPAAADG
jgi:MFS family permease